MALLVLLFFNLINFSNMDYTVANPTATVENSEMTIKSLRGAQIIIKLDFIKMDSGEKFTIDNDGTFVFYKDSFTVYQLCNPEQLLYRDVSLAKQNLQTQYFIFSNNSKKGLFLDSLHTKTPKWIDVDQIMSQRFVINSQFFVTPNDSLAGRKKEGASIIEKYLPKEKPDDTYCDTTELCFSKKADDISFSLASHLDRKDDGKLVRVRLIYNAIPKGKYPFAIPEREYYYEIKPVKITNADTIDALIERYKTHLPI